MDEPRTLHMNQELPVQAGFRKGKGNRDHMPTFIGSWRKQGNSRKTSTSASLPMLKPLTGSKHTVENSSRDGIL